MKLTKESIQESEKEFIDTINAELDWNVIEQMLLDKHGFSVEDDVDYKDGNLIVHNNEIAYKFDFEIKVPLSVVFNREGECLELSTRKEDPVSENDEINGQTENPLREDSGAVETQQEVQPTTQLPKEDMVTEIADMISEINKEGE